MKNWFVKFIATGCGAGYLPKMPGTAGSVLGVGLWWLLASHAWLWALYPLLVWLAVWSACRAAKLLNQTDPAAVVIDEIVGMPLALAGIAPVGWLVLTGFAAFRLFDIWKPWPIRQSQALPGGRGIVIDDLLAGGFACAVTHAIAWAVK